MRPTAVGEPVYTCVFTRLCLYTCVVCVCLCLRDGWVDGEGLRDGWVGFAEASTRRWRKKVHLTNIFTPLRCGKRKHSKTQSMTNSRREIMASRKTESTPSSRSASPPHLASTSAGQ